MINNDLLSIIIASSYVLAIYYEQPQNLKNLNRNNLQVLKYRLKRVSLLCALLILIIPNIIGESSYVENLKSIGIIPKNLKSIGNSLIFILIIYSSSIFKLLYTSNYQLIDFDQHWLIHFRDYIFAPITEELIYRGIVIFVSGIKWYTPFLFGIAHLHHGYQMYTEQQPIFRIFLVVLLQLSYTSLFGYLSQKIYVKYDYNLWCSILTHSICNLFGLPELKLDCKCPGGNIIFYTLLVIGFIAFIHELVV
ncbi:unnamed protein product [Candida verbasci]|uniref:intramembrane prenyl-peptidase Rce1 n=1 Tax=Candida verbasci TaxID=1227364 RepID=A0A9W4TWU5_9ASCO|nr:unnamed protein product [Candida verbasci]